MEGKRTTRNVDLGRSLRDHLNVDVAVGERGEHPARNSDHVLQSTDEREDRHVLEDRHLMQRPNEERVSLASLNLRKRRKTNDAPNRSCAAP